jgi:hypothetical protein
LVLAAFVAFAPTATAAPLVPVTNGTLVTNSSDDGVFGPFNLGFTFPFFGVNQTQVFINNNGNLTFGSGDSTFTNQPFPQGGSPPRIANFWDDLFEPPGEVRQDTTVPGQFTAIFNGTGFFSGAGTETSEATLLGPGNQFGAPAGTIILSYGSITGTNDGSVTVGLNAGNGVNFATLAGLGIGGSNGILNQAQAIGLSSGAGAFTFTPNGTGAFTVTAGIPQITPGGGGVPEPTSIALLGLGLCGIAGYRLRRRNAA